MRVLISEIIANYIPQVEAVKIAALDRFGLSL